MKMMCNKFVFAVYQYVNMDDKIIPAWATRAFGMELISISVQLARQLLKL